VSPVGIRRIEDGERRVSLDDLFSLSVALGVSPTTLLIPNADDGDEQVAATGITEKLDAERLWNWVRGDEPIDPAEHTQIPLAALPEWKQQQMLAHYQFRDPEFSGGRALPDNTGEAQ
jgi:transcriptional regulator with XRE-family HTH domain